MKLKLAYRAKVAPSIISSHTHTHTHTRARARIRISSGTVQLYLRTKHTKDNDIKNRKECVGLVGCVGPDEQVCTHSYLRKESDKSACFIIVGILQDVLGPETKQSQV
jgi:hypothetical protein